MGLPEDEYVEFTALGALDTYSTTATMAMLSRRLIAASGVASRLMGWSYPAPAQKVQLVEGRYGSRRFTDNDYEDRTITLTLDPSAGNVEGRGDGWVLNHSGIAATEDPVSTVTASGVVKREVKGFASSPYPTKLDFACEARFSITGKIRLSLCYYATGTGVFTAVTTKTVDVTAGQWTRIEVTLDQGIGLSGTVQPGFRMEGLTAAGAATGLPGGATLDVRRAILGQGARGIFFDAKTPGAQQVNPAASTIEAVTEAIRPASGEAWGRAHLRDLQRLVGAIGSASAPEARRRLRSGKDITFDLLSAKAETEENNEHYLGIEPVTLTIQARPLGRGAPAAQAGALLSYATGTAGPATFKTSLPIPGDVPALASISWPTINAREVLAHVIDTDLQARPGVMPASAFDNPSGTWPAPAANNEGQTVATGFSRSGPIGRWPGDIPLSTPVNASNGPITVAGDYEVAARMKSWSVIASSSDPFYNAFWTTGAIATQVTLRINGAAVATRTIPMRVRTGTGGTGESTFAAWRLVRFGKFRLVPQDDVALEFSGYPASSTPAQAVVDYVSFTAATSSALISNGEARTGPVVYGDAYSAFDTGVLNARNGNGGGTLQTSGTAWNIASGVASPATGAASRVWFSGTAALSWMAIRFQVTSADTGFYFGLIDLPGGVSTSWILARATATNGSGFLTLINEGANGLQSAGVVPIEGIPFSGLTEALIVVGADGCAWLSVIPANSGARHRPMARLPGVVPNAAWRATVNVGTPGTGNVGVQLSMIRAGTARTPADLLSWSSASPAKGDLPTLVPGRPAVIAVTHAETDVDPRKSTGAPTQTGPTAISLTATPRYLVVPDE